MSLHLDPSRDLGLQSILEEGVSFLRGGPTKAEREKRILSELAKIFSDAQRGSDRLSSLRLAVRSDEQLQLDRFGIFVQYLSPEYGTQLPNRLKEASDILAKIKTGDATANERYAVSSIVEALLFALQDERALRPLRAPRELRYGSA